MIGGIVLVVTTVHHPDDPRIRHKTIPSLQAVADVRYLSPAPGPIDTGGLQAPVVSGPRLVRTVHALRHMLRADVDVVVAHDPELLPLLWLTARRRHIPVVLDVHENLVARAGSPAGRGRLARGAVRGILRRCERTVLFTLAEDGYQSMFRRRHPVFPNHPVPTSLPHPRPTDPEGAIVYVGDVTRARGALLLVEAVARANLDNPLLLIGRCHRSLREEIVGLADRLGVTVEVSGWLSHGEAMSRAAGAAVAVCPLTDTPNYRHSLPTKVLEYLALGLPVVASDLPGTAAAIAGLPGVALVTPGDVEALSDGLEAALPAAQREAAARGSAAVRDRHQWPATAVQTFYADLLQRRRHR